MMATLLDVKTHTDTAADLTGITAGAEVVTLDGIMPAEFLEPGDRIVTRGGVRRLTALKRTTYTGRAYLVMGGSLGHAVAGRDTILTPRTQVLVRDWRAQVMFGCDIALVAIEALEDELFVKEVTVADMPLFTLVFEAPQIIYAGAMELAAGEFSPVTANA
jgi:Hint domain